MKIQEPAAQLEVSEWTLPGPSVGEVTDEGVAASCHPPLACKMKQNNSLVLQQDSKASKFDYTIEVLYSYFQSIL